MSGRYYVVSDVWCGRSEVIAPSAEEAAFHQYELTLRSHAKDADCIEAEQFRAWPAEDWPDHLTFTEAFEWIGNQGSPGNP